jgi:hypothetical protein
MQVAVDNDDGAMIALNLEKPTLCVGLPGRLCILDVFMYKFWWNPPSMFGVRADRITVTNRRVIGADLTLSGDHISPPAKEIGKLEQRSCVP